LYGASLVALAALTAAPAAFAQRQVVAHPRWIIEIKAGELEPEVERYEEFYGERRSSYYALGFAYRFRSWLEAGGEIGRLRETGTGLLAEDQVPGGAVTYTLAPAHAFVTLRGVFKPGQLFVPYLGLGLTEAYYEQKVESQADRTGRSDLGGLIRVGLQLSLNRLDPDARGGYDTGEVKQSYLFIEAQRFSTEQDEFELGGDAAFFGFRFEFGRETP
jgi:hypothetical protein